MDGSGSVQFPDDIGCQNIFDRVQVLSGPKIIVTQQGTTVTTETNEEDSFVINPFSGSTVFQIDQ